MTSLGLEVGLHWVAVSLYVVASVLFAYAVLFAPARHRLPLWITATGLVPHSAALLLRWIRSGHGPYMVKYEVLSSNAWIVLVMLAVLLARRPEWSAGALVVVPAAFLMMAVGLLTDPAVRELPPSLRSIWLVFHVLFAKLATAAFLLSVAAATLLLRKLRGGAGGVLDRLPAPDVMEAYMIRFVGFGFIFWTVNVAAGAIWANQSWGRYWGWDAVETWSLVTWLCYGTLLHARLFFKPRAARTAMATIACFLISVVTAFIVPFLLTSLHSAYFQ